MARPRSTHAAPAKAKSPCACSGSSVDAGSGADRRAHAVDAGLKAENLVQLRRIEGQVRGIAAMVAEERYCADIITQIAAVRESLHTVARQLMQNHLKQCAAAAFREEGRARDKMVDELLQLVGKLSR